MSNIILAIDSSVNTCSVALYKNKNVYSLLEICKKEHNLKILPMIKQILFNTKTKFKELSMISFSKGPGNFTGIRISASVAQSFSLSLNIPIVGISTLMLLAEKTWRIYKKKNILVAMQAQKEKVYWAQYIRHQPLIWEGKVTESLLKFHLVEKKINQLKENWTLVGNGWENIKCNNFFQNQKKNIFFPDAQDIISFSLLYIQQNKQFTIMNAHPNYLHDIF